MNKKWTKIAALLGIFLLGLSLIGCGTESEKSDGQGTVKNI